VVQRRRWWAHWPGFFSFFEKSLHRELIVPPGAYLPRRVPPALGGDAFAVQQSREVFAESLLSVKLSTREKAPSPRGTLLSAKAPDPVVSTNTFKGLNTKQKVTDCLGFSIYDNIGESRSAFLAHDAVSWRPQTWPEVL
jgi:hypothetical protein